MDTMFLVFGRLGWKFQLASGARLEAGLKLFLPISPSRAPHFRVREKGGVLSPWGKNYGGEELHRMLTAYLEGSF